MGASRDHALRTTVRHHRSRPTSQRCFSRTTNFTSKTVKTSLEPDGHACSQPFRMFDDRTTICNRRRKRLFAVHVSNSGLQQVIDDPQVGWTKGCDDRNTLVSGPHQLRDCVIDI